MQGKRIKTKVVCPRCNGTGKARTFNRTSKYSEKTRRLAQGLYDKDLSLRKIAEKLKLKHPQTVKNILKNTTS